MSPNEARDETSSGIASIGSDVVVACISPSSQRKLSMRRRRRTSGDPETPLDNSECKFLICCSVSTFFVMRSPSGTIFSDRTVVPSAPLTCFRRAFPFPLTFPLCFVPTVARVSSYATESTNPVHGTPLPRADVLVEDEIVSHQIASADLLTREGGRVVVSVAGVEGDEVATGEEEEEDDGGGLRCCRREARCDRSFVGSVPALSADDAVSIPGAEGASLEVDATGGVGHFLSVPSWASSRFSS